MPPSIPHNQHNCESGCSTAGPAAITFCLFRCRAEPQGTACAMMCMNFCSLCTRSPSTSPKILYRLNNTKLKSSASQPTMYSCISLTLLCEGCVASTSTWCSSLKETSACIAVCDPWQQMRMKIAFGFPMRMSLNFGTQKGMFL
jgi:hypothetical protein